MNFAHIFKDNVELNTDFLEDSINLPLFTQWIDNIKNNGNYTTLNSFAESPKGEAILKTVFTYSPFLSRLITKEATFVNQILNDGFEDQFQSVFNDVSNILDDISSEEELMKKLREAKRKIALLIGLADLVSFWDVHQVTYRLSVFADACVTSVSKFLLFSAHQKKEIELNNTDSPFTKSGLIILAMGKLGGYELNYSSDIDLIVFFDETFLQYNGRYTPQHFFIKLTQRLSQILNEKTRDGYVFRVDLRLRPDPGSTQAAVSISHAMNYYENLGQNWERAAFIKARILCGDNEVYTSFAKQMMPFIWRKSLDFHSIQDIHSIKRQIDSRQGKLPENLLGYNIKLGHGGIREIEFFVQVQQLIFGGRRTILQKASTCDVLNLLVKAGEITQLASDDLTHAYEFYRNIEHRLQMVDDQQTHSLPRDLAGMQNFAHFCGYSTVEELIEELSQNIKIVQSYYGDLFDSSPSLAIDDIGSLVFTGTDDDPETLNTLARLNFTETSAISKNIRGWHHGRYRSTKPKRSRELLTELMPAMLKSLGQTINPDVAFRNFDEFLSKIPGGLQIFSLLAVNPKLLDLIAEIMGGYPYLAKNLAIHPHLLDYVLAPEFYNA